MVTRNQTRTLDGVTDFDIYGRNFEWDGNFIERVRGSLPAADDGTLTLNFVDAWDIDVAKFNSDGLLNLVINDLDAAEREFEFLRLGSGDATVNFTSTEARFIVDDEDGNHTLNLGSARTTTIDLNDGDHEINVGTGDVRLVNTGGGDDTVRALSGGEINFVDLSGGTNFFETNGFFEAYDGNGDDTVIVRQGGGGDSIVVGGGTNAVTTEAGTFVGAITSFSGDNTIDVFGDVRSVGVSGGRDVLTVRGSGNVEQAQLGGDNDTANVNGGRVGSLDLGGGFNTLAIRNGGEVTQVTAGIGRDTVTVDGRIEQLLLGSGNNTVTLTDGTIISIEAGGGNDTFNLAGGLVDSVSMGGGTNRITTGTEFTQSITAFAGRDIVTVGTGGAGQVKLDGGGSTVLARGFVDSIVTFGGRDVVTVDDGAGSVRTGAGADAVTVRGTGNATLIDVGDDNDVVNFFGGAFANTVMLGNGFDRVSTGTAFVDTILAFDGFETVQIGSGGAGFVKLNDGGSAINARGFVDAIVTQAGEDVVSIGNGAGSVRTGDGDDRVTIGARGGTNSVQLGDGDDTIAINGFVQAADGDDGDDTFLVGGDGFGLLRGGDGDDTFVIRGIDPNNGGLIDGSGGTDTIDFTFINRDVTFDLNSAAFQNPAAPGGALNLPGRGFIVETSIENIIGSARNDTLTGSDGANVLTPGNGNDTLTGRAGADIFAFDAADNIDVITDFELGVDQIRLAGQTDLSNVSFAQSGADTVVNFFNTRIRVEDTLVADLNDVANFDL